MVGESFHPRGCWGEDSDHIRLGATVPKTVAPFRFCEGNSGVAGVIEVSANDGSQNCFCRKFLTGSLILSYTKKVARSCGLRTVKETIPMLMSWTNKEHTTKRPATAARRGVCLWAGLSSSVNMFNGRLGQTSVDSRYIRH